MKRTLKLSFVVITVLTIALTLNQLASAALFITKAELQNGDELRLEGEDAVPDATIWVDGTAMGTADGDGEFRIEQDGFTSPTCTITVSDGTTTDQATLEECTASATATATAAPPTPTITPTPTDEPPTATATAAPPTSTPAPTATATPIPTATPTPTDQPPTATATPAPPTPAPTLTPTPTATATASNQPPVAEAGPDQTIEDGDGDGVEVVTLDGSGSSDLDGAIVSYEWREDGVPLEEQNASLMNGSTASSADSSWWTQVQHDLTESEYRASANGQGLQAPNRAHNLRTYFAPAGIAVHDRTAPDDRLLAGLSLNGLGRNAALKTVAPGRVTEAGARVEIRRDGLTEWYENGPRGLEQGFTVTKRPAGTGPLVLELTVTGAEATVDGASITLDTEAGRKLFYSHLIAWDANNRLLTGRMEAPNPQTIRLVVDDGGAAYPLVIDPLITGVADAMLESNQPDPDAFLPAAFGGSVASAGDVNGDGFDDVIVGAPGWDGGDPHEGAAFVFLGSAAGIVGSDPSSAHAQIESNQAFAQLGTVAGAGDVNGDGFDDIIVGAHFYSDVLPEDETLEVNGAAFVFHGGPSGITGTDPTTADAWIGANELNSDLGAFVSGAGDVNGDGFDDVVVGVPGHGTPFSGDIPPNQRSGDHGAALVFHGSPAGITGTGFDDADAVILSYEDTGQPEPTIYGKIRSVAVAGDVDGDGFDDVVLGGSEIALFPGSASGIVGSDLTMAQSRVQPGGPHAPFSLNAAAAGDINGDGFADVIASSPFRDREAGSTREEGVVFVFVGGASGLAAADTTQAHATFTGSMLAEWVGLNVAGAGDVDGDGFDDIVFSARIYPGSLTSEGVAYLFRGSGLGITADDLLGADARLEARQSGAVVLGNNMAIDTAGAGDVNGDGFDDVITGKGYYDAGEENEGAAFIYLGEAWPADVNQPPVADAGADQVVTDLDDSGSETVTLDGSASFDPDGTIVSYAWYEGETLLGTSPTLVTDLTATGDHELALVVTDDEGVSRGDPVIVHVDIPETPRVFFDSFESLDAWVTEGDVLLSNADSFPTPPQARLGAAGATLRRSAALPEGATGIRVDFWAKASQFAAGDELLVKASVDGGPFTTLLTLTAADSDDAYHFYGGTGGVISLSWHPATASNVVLEFESRMNGGRFFVDDVDLRAIIAPTEGNQSPVASAGADQIVEDGDNDGVEQVLLDGSASFDPDGSIVSYAWHEGATLLGNTASLTAELGVGDHELTLTVTDDEGLAASDTIAVSVVAPSPSPFLTAPLSMGVHTIELTVTDDEGATATDTVVITVDAPASNQPPTADLGISAPGSANRGDHFDVTMTVVNTGESTAPDVELTISWSPGDRLKDLSAPSTVSLGDIGPGQSASFTWNVRADNEGSTTITGATTSGGADLATASHEMEILK